MFHPLLFVDKFLNSITIYRLVLYGLFIIAFFGVAFGFLEILPLNGLHMLLSLVILIFSSASVNYFLGYLFKVPVNSESSYITALILFLILPPAGTLFTAILLVVASIVAMTSKFLINLKGKHVFNPAGFGALVIGLGVFIGPAFFAPTWWVGSMVMLPIVTVIGLLVVRKIQRFDLLFAFLGVVVIACFGLSIYYGDSFLELLRITAVSGPVIFFGTIMLTEPLTSPPTQKMRIAYGVLVGFLFMIPYHIGSLYSTPELGLLIGNAFAYFVSPKERLILQLKEKLQLAPMVYDFIFTPNQKMSFTAGQYMEWTLDHKSDGRGNRRFFTIASSPTESEIHMGIKVPADPSSFKKALLDLEPGDELMAGGLAGEFNLPKNSSEKIVAIAGGVGITPFRSMIKAMVDTGNKRDLTLFYVSSHEQEFVYKDVLTSAESVGVKTVYLLSVPNGQQLPSTWKGHTGFITKELLVKEVPDFLERSYYISGPPGMVQAYKTLLVSVGVSRSKITTDYFPGY